MYYQSCSLIKYANRDEHQRNFLIIECDLKEIPANIAKNNQYEKLLVSIERIIGLMDKVSASQPWDHGFKPHTGHDRDSSYDTSN